jgi:HEAT repeat protein
MRPASWATWISATLLLAAGHLRAADEDSLSADERTLRGAHLNSDGPSLIDYVRKLTPRTDHLDQIPALIRQLGDESFAKREEATRQLLAIGPAAAPNLRQAATHADPEVRRRAQGCLQHLTRAPDAFLFAGVVTPLAAFRPQPGALEVLVASLSAWDAQEKKSNPMVMAAAVRMLAARRPPGAAQALLDYLPYAAEGSLTEELESALAGMALQKGAPEPAIVGALEDRFPFRRSAAAVALCRSGGFPVAKLVRPLLGDPDPAVRQRVAMALADLRDPEAMPVLIALLDQVLPSEAAQVEDMLRQWAGEFAPPAPPPHPTASTWRKARETWGAWSRTIDAHHLLLLFHRRTPPDGDRERMLRLVRELGDDDFNMREQASARLRDMGPVALPILRQALKDLDPEVVQRAQECKTEVEKSWRISAQAGVTQIISLASAGRLLTPGLVQNLQALEKDPAAKIPNGAARLLALRHPPGAAAGLLAYVPFAEDEMEIDDIQGALTTLACQGGVTETALVRALDDKISLRRGVAAVALCKARAGRGPESQRLLHDRDPLVRLRVALALAELKDKEAVPELIDLVGLLSEEQAWQAEDLLRRLAGDQSPLDNSRVDSTSRRQWRDAWAAWWRENSGRIDMNALDRVPRLMGYTVVAEYTEGRNGRIIELGSDGNIRWKVDNIPWPLDVQVLPGQRLLLAEFYDNRVAERNFRGELLWHKQLTQAPLTARRLANGNTLVVTQNQILEVDRSGREVVTLNRPGVLAAERLPGGRWASIDSAGAFSVVDASGRSVRSFTVGAFQSYSSFQVLPNGGVVVPLKSQNQVVEYNAQGARVWQGTAPQPTSVVRLPNGHTLVACRDTQMVVELDRSGKEVWQHKSTGYPWRAYRR